jgi:hypothetical protein
LPSQPQKTYPKRQECPVFVVGCHRSGTNLVYDTLLSAGGFAIYRGYIPIYKTLQPRFGDLNDRDNRQKVLETWLRSKGFRRSGLDPAWLSEKILAECHSAGDFLRIVMGEIARSQQAARWALYDPDNVLHMRAIKQQIPEALFIHMIRDGRDIALSLHKMGGFQPLPWDRGSRDLAATALYWEWMVRKGAEYGRREIPNDYIEVHYEDLVSNPRRVLEQLGTFLDHDLDYDRIQRSALGRVSEPNSSFRDEEAPEERKSLNRWKERLSPKEVAALESLVGDCLQEFGYTPVTPAADRSPNLQGKAMRVEYPAYLAVKQWLKLRTPAGRLASVSELELADAVPQGDPAS